MSDRDPRGVCIVAAKRTPIGAFQGALAGVRAPELGARALKATLEAARVDAAAVDEVYMGNVLSAGIGQAPARQAAIAAGLGEATPTTTVSKVCGSGLQAVILGARQLRSGEAECVAVGGMESMSQAPYLLPRARDGYRMGHGKVVDAMIHDGLWDPYDDMHMGHAGELCAREYAFDREAQDRFARASYEKALSAQAAGHFAAELAPVTVKSRKAETEVASDEEPGRGKLDKFPALRPAFDPQGTITAANASPVNDGAAALLLCTEAFAAAHGLEVLARLGAARAHAQAPKWFTTAPVGAARSLLEASPGLSVDAVDLWEVNEAFSVVPMAFQRELGVPEARVNVHGGAVALGHPIGASGARILVTLVHALRQRELAQGVAAICIGGGEGLALHVHRS